MAVLIFAPTYTGRQERARENVVASIDNMFDILSPIRMAQKMYAFRNPGFHERDNAASRSSGHGVSEDSLSAVLHQSYLSRPKQSERFIRSNATDSEQRPPSPLPGTVSPADLNEKLDKVAKILHRKETDPLENEGGATLKSPIFNKERERFREYQDMMEARSGDSTALTDDSFKKQHLLAQGLCK